MTISFMSDVASAISDFLMLEAVWPFVGLGLIAWATSIIIKFIRGVG